MHLRGRGFVMVRVFRHYVSPLKLTMALVDFFIILLCVFLAEWGRMNVADVHFVIDGKTFLAKLLVPVIMTPILIGVGAYHTDAINDMRVLYIRLFVAIISVSIAVSAVLYLLPMISFWRSSLILSMALIFFIIPLIRLVFFKLSSASFLSRRVLLLGAGLSSLTVSKYAEKVKEAGLVVVDVVRFEGEESCTNSYKEITDLPSLPEYVKQNNIELILIEDSDNKGLPVSELTICKLSGIEIKSTADFLEQARGFVDLKNLKTGWIVFSDGFRGGSYLERFTKRAFDVVISFAVLILSFPLILLAAIGVCITSPGPILYKQERVGRYGMTFNVLKFRSMRQDAEKGGKPEWAKEKDPRITKFGNFLRRSRIDELPQLINVLRGDMSFVGPRPERPYFVEQLEETIPYYKERHYLKPGITGWAQVRYPYGASIEDSRRKLEYDLYYVKNYSVFLDFLIILQTVRVVLFPDGVR